MEETNLSQPFESFDFTHLWDTLRRYWLVIMLATLLGAAGGLAGSMLQTPVYQANVRMMVTHPAQEQTGDLTNSLNNQQLTTTYQQFVKLDVVLDEVRERLGYGVNAGSINTSVLTNTLIIEIKVENIDPRRAAEIANTLVDVLSQESDLVQGTRYGELEASLQAQIFDIEEKIDDTQDAIDARTEAVVVEQAATLEGNILALEQQIVQTRSDIQTFSQNPALAEARALKEAELERQLSLLEAYRRAYNTLLTSGSPNVSSDAELSRLDKTLQLYQQIYISRLTSLENLRLTRLQTTPNVVRLSTATEPANPIRPDTTQNILLGAAAGLALALAFALVMYFIDNTIKSREDVARILKLPIIGKLGNIEPLPADSPSLLQVAAYPRSPVAEAFRTLRTNLEFSSIDKPLRSILVTSSAPDEGKTTVAANLAGVLAQSGKRVAVLDADMRRPSLHQAFGLQNRFGLSDLFRQSENTLADYAQPFDSGGGVSLRVFTSGALPPNPSELIHSERMEKILRDILAEVDFLVIDSPPMIVTDAQLLAGKVDGVLFVVRAGITQADEARNAGDLLSKTRARILGVVLNQVKRGVGRGYGDYYGPDHSG